MALSDSNTKRERLTVTSEDLKTLQKDVRKKKRIATEKAAAVHDLVEDRLWTDYEELLELSQQTVSACKDWSEATKALAAHESELA